MFRFQIAEKPFAPAHCRRMSFNMCYLDHLCRVASSAARPTFRPAIGLVGLAALDATRHVVQFVAFATSREVIAPDGPTPRPERSHRGADSFHLPSRSGSTIIVGGSRTGTRSTGRGGGAMSRDDEGASPPRRPKPKAERSKLSEGQDTFQPASKPAASKPRRSIDDPRPETGGPTWLERILFGSVGFGQLATFCGQFARYQEAGVDLIRSLSSLQKQFARSALGPGDRSAGDGRAERRVAGLGDERASPMRSTSSPSA